MIESFDTEDTPQEIALKKHAQEKLEALRTEREEIEKELDTLGANPTPQKEELERRLIASKTQEEAYEAVPRLIAHVQKERQTVQALQAKEKDLLEGLPINKKMPN